MVWLFEGCLKKIQIHITPFEYRNFSDGDFKFDNN